MPVGPHSKLFDSLTPIQIEVLKALVEGLSMTAAAARGGVHRSTVHLWTRNIPAFAEALLTLRQDRADRIGDELGDLTDLAIDTFRQILSDESASASVRLKAAMEIVKLVEAERPTELAHLKMHQHFDRVFDDIRLAEVATVPEPAAQSQAAAPKAPVRNAPCPCEQSAEVQALLRQIFKSDPCCVNHAVQKMPATRIVRPRSSL